MTQFPNEDKDLVNFLRQHRPEVPPAAADLEQQILRNVETLHPTLPTPNLRRRSPFWLAQSLVAAGLVAAVVGYRSLIPVQTSPAELAKLETFMENNWHGTIGDTPESDVFSVSEPMTN